MTGRHLRRRCARAAAVFATGLLVTGEVAAHSRPTAPAKTPDIYGVNLATGGFAPERIPGRHGVDYIYPDRETAAPFVQAGMNSVRLPILWERIQPKPFSNLSEAEMAQIDKSLRDLRDFRTVILDVHNYGRYRGAVLGEANAPPAALADLWARLAKRYRNSPNIAFGIMNEPHGIGGRDWRKMADRTVAAIRATGARNLILVPGTRWSGGHSWFEGGADSNAAAFADFRDPGNNFAFEIHQYFDRDSSGTHHSCMSKEIGRQRLAPVTSWLRQRKARAVLGEFGTAPDADCLRTLKDVMEFLDANADVWRGWTYWAGGAWWGDYPKSIQPSDGRKKPQMRVLEAHLARYGSRPR